MKFGSGYLPLGAYASSWLFPLSRQSGNGIENMENKTFSSLVLYFSPNYQDKRFFFLQCG